MVGTSQNEVQVILVWAAAAKATQTKSIRESLAKARENEATRLKEVDFNSVLFSRLITFLSKKK